MDEHAEEYETHVTVSCEDGAELARLERWSARHGVKLSSPGSAATGTSS
jgi:hypothetical protein